MRDEWEDLTDDVEDLHHLYATNSEFRKYVDEHREEMERLSSIENARHFYAVLNRSAHLVLWTRRIAGKHWRRAAALSE